MVQRAKLSLPAGISVTRQGKSYVIYQHDEEIGGVELSGTEQGDTQLRPYLTLDNTSNQAIVASVAQQMSDTLLVHVAKKPEYLQRKPFPPHVPAGTEVFENKAFPCSKCDQIIGKLLFADDISSVEEMENIAKKFELEASVSTYPVWIIGAPDDENDDIAKHLTLQISPSKGELCWEHPDKMNQRLIALDSHHC